MSGGSKAYPHMKKLKKTDKKMWKKLTRTVRDDGAWIDAGENDNLMVSKLVANPDAVGVFGYSFLDQNSDKIKGAVLTARSRPSKILPVANTKSRGRCFSTSSTPMLARFPVFRNLWLNSPAKKLLVKKGIWSPKA